MTPEGELILAVTQGDLKAASAAIAGGADISTSSVDGKSLLRHAGEQGRRDICELLVKAGADPNEVNGVRQLSLLHNAAAAANYGFASILLDLGANPSAKASNDATPLHIAARTGEQFLVEKLLKHGAKINAHDNQGRTPLHLAVESGDLGMAKLLIKKGCNVTPNTGHRSPLSMAIANENNEIKELLLSHGAEQREPRRQKHVSKVAEQSDNQGRLF